MPEEDLRLRAKSEGFDAAADDVGEVTEAEQKLERQTRDTAAASDEQTRATLDLEAAEGDFFAVATQIDPVLGSVAQAMVESAKVAGTLSRQTIDLSAAWRRGAELLKEYSGALKLLGAGGAAAAGVAALISAFRQVREEQERALAATRDQIDALDELAKRRGAQRVDIERASAARAEGPLGAQESQTALRAIEDLRKGVTRDASDQARQQAVLLAGGGADEELLQRLTLLIDNFGDQVDFDKLLGRPLEQRLAILDRTMERVGDRIDSIAARERAQIGGVPGEAFRVAQSGAGSTRSVEEFIRNLPGRAFEGEDVEQIAEIVRALQGLPDKSDITDILQVLQAGAEAQIGSADIADLLVQREKLSDQGIEADEGQIRLAEIVLRQLLRAAEEQREAAQAQKDAAGAQRQAAQGGTTVINDNRGARITAQDAQARRRMTRNGENERTRRAVG